MMTTCLNICRKNVGSSDALIGERSEASARTIDSDLKLDVASALDSLPLRQRQAVLLYYLADLPVAAVADLMQTSEGTVKTHLSRGRTALSHLLMRVEEDPS